MYASVPKEVLEGFPEENDKGSINSKNRWLGLENSQRRQNGIQDPPERKMPVTSFIFLSRPRMQDMNHRAA